MNLSPQTPHNPNMAFSNALRVLTWNAASLSLKIGELRELVSRNTPDIILVQETQLNAPNRVSIPNYTLKHGLYG